MPGADLLNKVIASGARRMLMVLPSCTTSQRQEAVEAERMLEQVIISPADAAERQAAADTPTSGTCSDNSLVSQSLSACQHDAPASSAYRLATQD